MSSRWLSRLAVATAAAGVLTIGVASAVWADATININPGQVPTTAKQFGTQECDGPFEGLPGDKDGWHFILPAGAGDDFLSVTLTFSSPGGTVTATVTSRDPNAPSTGAGWSGYIAEAGGSDVFRHLWLFTDAGWTLTAGTATVSGTPGQNPQFVLSHTCPGTPASPSNPPSSPPSDPSNPPSSPGVPPSSGGGGGVGGGLPVTGPAIGGAIVLGLGLVGGGIALVMMRRRRNVFDSGA